MRAIITQLTSLDVEKYKANMISRFEEVIRDMWQKNGDQCSVIYAGTGALEGKSKVAADGLHSIAIEYKKFLSHQIKDASRSLVRTIQNNLMDTSKQESFDLFLLGRLFGSQQFDELSNLLPSSLLRGHSYLMKMKK